MLEVNSCSASVVSKYAALFRLRAYFSVNLLFIMLICMMDARVIYFGLDK